MLRRVVQTSSACASRVVTARPVARNAVVRRGHGHANSHHHHQSNEPYAIKHHDHYPDEAYAFGIKPGDAAEGWEYLTYGVYAACTLILVLGMNMKSNDDFKVTLGKVIRAARTWKQRIRYLSIFAPLFFAETVLLPAIDN